MSDTDNRTVTRRRVFYIPGYDPIPPRRYRELYRNEGAAQAALAGYALELSAKRTGSEFGWHVVGDIEDGKSEVDVEVLVWSDIVRDSMDQGIAATYWQLLRTAWTYMSTGSLWRLMRLRKGPVIAALYPVGFLIVQALIAAIAAFGMARVVTWVSPAVLPAPVGQLAGWSVGAILFISILRWFRRRDGKFFAYYLMHDYAYGARTRGANPPELEARLAEFTAIIASAMNSDADEVLVVGHSSGAHLAVSVLADLIRSGRVPVDGPVLGFLSLGQVVPMVSFLPDAVRLRADLRYLCTRDELTWVDVTAPGDGCAFALCDPVAVTGVAPRDQRWPLVISAAFTQTLSPARWKELRWRFFRLHFQYLCAFDNLEGNLGEYDYFRVTAGPRTLAARFAGRKPSQSRLTKPLNRYTSVS